MIDTTQPEVMVEGVGDPKAKIMLIGEAPGENEVEKREPFVGRAGSVLDSILEEVGLSRNGIYITNTVRCRPPANNFRKRYYEKVGTKVVPTGELLKEYQRLYEEIARVGPRVIVPMGNEAMKAVLGYEGVLKYRGSILESTYGWVVPTLHPAFVLRSWSYRPAVVCDFQRIKKVAKSKEYVPTKRDLVARPTYKEVMDAIKEAHKARFVAFDIETEADQICAISLSYRRGWAICIPFWFGQLGSLWGESQEVDIWNGLRRLLESEQVKKIAHNGMFDIEYLQRSVGINVRGFYFDTMLGFHCLHPELPKGLDYVSSIYTDEPYYKDDLKTDDMLTFFRYSAMDSAVTYECGMELIHELGESGLGKFYRYYIHSLVGPLLSMQRRGVCFDTEARNRMRKEYRLRVARGQTKLEELVGHPLNTASHPQMVKWLYEELGLPKQYKKRVGGNKTLAADEEALHELYNKTKNEAIQTILEIRECNKILTTYLNIRLDEDKRVRCSYNISGTETGRLSSSTTTRGTGTNLQNIPKSVKKLFVADEGKVFINADLSQAEARVVAYVSGEERLIKVFEEGGDIHRKNAAGIFGKGEDQVTDEERQLAKRVVHACLTGEHEVLTKNGWRPMRMYNSLNSEIAVWYPVAGSCGRIKFEKPLAWNEYAYSGNLHQLEGTALKALCTPEHKWPVRTTDTRIDGVYVSKREARSLPKYGRIPTAGFLEWGEQYNAVNIALMVAIQADGSIDKGGHVRFHLVKQRKVRRLENLLKLSNRKYTKRVKGGDTHIYISSKDIEDVTNLFCITHLFRRKKEFELGWLMGLNLEAREAFLDELVLWDGYVSGTVSNRKEYITTSACNARAVQTIAAISGRQAVLTHRKEPMRKRLYTVSFNRRKAVRIESLKQSLVPRRSVKVYCPTVSTGYFLVRYKDTIYPTSNSNYGMGPGTFSKTAGISMAEARRLLNRYFATYPRIKVWHMKVAADLRKSRVMYTPLGRRRVFTNLYSDSLVKEALAYIPQSTVADILNRALVKMDKAGVEVLLQVHDSVLVQCNNTDEDIARVKKILKDCLESSVELGGRVVRIPSDFVVGTNWLDMKEERVMEVAKTTEGYEKLKAEGYFDLVDKRVFDVISQQEQPVDANQVYEIIGGSIKYNLVQQAFTRLKKRGEITKAGTHKGKSGFSRGVYRIVEN